MSKFMQKSVVVEAVQANENQCVHKIGGQFLVRKGEWIVSGLDGQLYKYTDETFHKLFKPLEKEINMYSTLQDKESANTGKLMDLEEARERSEAIILEAQAALDAAKAQQKSTGNYIDPEEFARLKKIVREETANLHSIHRQIKSINKGLCVVEPFVAAFYQAALEHLDDETFQRISKIAAGH